MEPRRGKKKHAAGSKGCGGSREEGAGLARGRGQANKPEGRSPGEAQAGGQERRVQGAVGAVGAVGAGGLGGSRPRSRLPSTRLGEEPGGLRAHHNRCCWGAGRTGDQWGSGSPGPEDEGAEGWCGRGA